MTAFLRRDSTQVVLVVANLGVKTARGVAIDGATGLSRRDYALRALFGDARLTRRMRVAANGSVSGFIPLDALAPMHGYIFELTHRPRRGTLTPR